MASDLKFHDQSECIEILFCIINKQIKIMQQWSPNTVIEEKHSLKSKYIVYISISTEIIKKTILN